VYEGDNTGLIFPYSSKDEVPKGMERVAQFAELTAKIGEGHIRWTDELIIFIFPEDLAKCDSLFRRMAAVPEFLQCYGRFVARTAAGTDLGVFNDHGNVA